MVVFCFHFRCGLEDFFNQVSSQIVAHSAVGSFCTLIVGSAPNSADFWFLCDLFLGIAACAKQSLFCFISRIFSSSWFPAEIWVLDEFTYLSIFLDQFPSFSVYSAVLAPRFPKVLENLGFRAPSVEVPCVLANDMTEGGGCAICPTGMGEGLIVNNGGQLFRMVAMRMPSLPLQERER